MGKLHCTNNDSIVTVV